MGKVTGKEEEEEEEVEVVDDSATDLSGHRRVTLPPVVEEVMRCVCTMYVCTYVYLMHGLSVRATSSL